MPEPQHLPSIPVPGLDKPTLGQRASSKVAAVVGSWTFIIAQSVILTTWVILNVFKVVGPWDPYPFILMNLVLSMQAAYTAPMIMMAQNREASKDRYLSKSTYYVGTKTDSDVVALRAIVERQSQQIQQLTEMLEVHLKSTLRDP